MALIKCTECGKEFSDRAVACPNCGCPTDIILEDIEKEKSIQQKKIVASYDIGDYKFEIDSKMDYRIRLISDFCQKRDQIKVLAEKMYDEFGNIDNVIEQMPQSFSIILEGAINAAIDLLMKNKIMECDVNYFISNYGEELDAASLMEPIIVEYLKILKLDTEIKEYHDYIRNVHRNAWSGGGFGVKGAVKGYFKAQMMNAGNAFLTSFSDTKEFNNNMQEVRKAKAELFAREETKQCVVESVLRIYTVCYTIALNKLKNADIIDGTFFNTNKSDSIMNNVYNYLNNGEESEIDSEWLVDSCLQAFLEDPTSEEAIYLLVRLLGENRMEPKTGIILYAKEYGFWNTYIDQRIDEVAEECENDINDFVKLAELPNENAEAVSKTIDSFHNLKYKFMLSGIFTNWNQVLNKLHFDLYLKAAVEKNLKYDKSLDEKEKVLEKVKSARDDEFDEHNQEATDTFKFYNSVIEKIEKTREIDYDRKNLLDLVERVCKSHSNDNDCTKANGFYFWNLYNIKQHEDFKYFNNAVNLPNECKIYLLCGKMQYNPKVPKYVIAITEYGMYVYQKRTDEIEGIQLFYSWHNLDNLKFEVCPEGGIYIGGKLFKYYTWELVHIVSDLRRQVKEFLENPTQYSDDEQNTTVKEDKNTEQFSENTVEQNEKARKCIVAAIDQFAQGWSNRENFVLKDDLRELEASNRPYTEKTYNELGVLKDEKVLGLITCPISQEAQFPRQIAITDKKIRWYNNDGKVYYCEWKDFIKHEVKTKLDGSVLWNGYYLFTSEIIDPLTGNRIKKLLTLISDNLQKESIDRVVQKNNTDTSSSETVSEENSSDSACTANEIIDYSKSGDFKSLGCQKSLDAMCQCLNSEKTIEIILKELNALAIDYSGCATRDVNADLLFKVVEVRAASRYFDTEEEPLFYKDSAIMFYGKNGLLITNKAIYRIKKNGLRKILFSKLESLHLIDILNGRDECKWCFNGIREFDLDAIGIDSKWSGTIMALVCLLFKKNQPGKKIKFFNFV